MRLHLPIIFHLLAHALYGPLLLAQRATVILFHPERHAAEMEAVVAFAPHYHAILFTIGIFLAFALTTKAGI